MAALAQPTAPDEPAPLTLCAASAPLCLWCDEPILPAEWRTAQVYASGQAVHYECGLRSMLGSVGHQQRRCSCYGGAEEDPPGLSRREGARAAAAYFHRPNS